ncbi:MAG: glycosyltransferase [Bacillota bacterium]|nr:glycosyltransferase [Bacillota bacterium]
MPPKKKIKVLHLLSSNRFSGAENVVFQIINLFNDESFEMVYASRDGQIREACEKEDIKFYPLTKVSINEVSKAVKEYQPDIIHAHDVRASVVASFFSKKAKIVSHMHVNHENMSKCNIKTIIYLARANRFKHIFWVSNSSFNKYKFKDRLISRSSILYNVIDPKKIIMKSQSDAKNYDYDVVYLGRLSYQKNPERLINVLVKAIKIKEDLRAAIIGTGELEKKAQDIVRRNKIQDNISFLGFLSNPLKIVKDAKVMIMTSRFEGTPMCALEAMALGVPIVSTPVDGLVDVIQNDKTGYLSEDDDMLAEKVVEISCDINEYSRLSSNTLEHFNKINNLSAYYSEIYRVYLASM